MKLFLLATIFISSVAYGQQFRINPDCIDSLSTGSFHVAISGEAEFNDSMVVLIEVFSNDSLHTVFFSGVKNFSDEANTTMDNFMVDSLNHTFSVSLTDLPSTQYYIFIRSSILGEMKEEILIPAFITI